MCSRLSNHVCVFHGYYNKWDSRNTCSYLSLRRLCLFLRSTVYLEGCRIRLSFLCRPWLALPLTCIQAPPVCAEDWQQQWGIPEGARCSFLSHQSASSGLSLEESSAAGLLLPGGHSQVPVHPRLWLLAAVRPWWILGQGLWGWPPVSSPWNWSSTSHWHE